MTGCQKVLSAPGTCQFAGTSASLVCSYFDENQNSIQCPTIGADTCSRQQESGTRCTCAFSQPQCLCSTTMPLTEGAVLFSSVCLAAAPKPLPSGPVCGGTCPVTEGKIQHTPCETVSKVVGFCFSTDGGDPPFGCTYLGPNDERIACDNFATAGCNPNAEVLARCTCRLAQPVCGCTLLAIGTQNVIPFFHACRQPVLEAAVSIPAPPSAPVEAPEPTHVHHHKHHDSSSDDDEEEEAEKKHEHQHHSSPKKHHEKEEAAKKKRSDDDDDSSETQKKKSSHKHSCRNGRREEGEQCDGPFDDTWFSVCNDRCEFEIFFPSAFGMFIILAIFVWVIFYFGTSWCHRRLVVARPVRKVRVMVCDLHNAPNCTICGGATVAVVKNAPAAPAAPTTATTPAAPGAGEAPPLIKGILYGNSSSSSSSSSNSINTEKKTKKK